MFFRFAELTSAPLPNFDIWSSISSESSRASGPGNSIGKMKTSEQNYILEKLNMKDFSIMKTILSNYHEGKKSCARRWLSSSPSLWLSIVK